MRPSEHAEQVSLFKWVAYSRAKYPELALIYAIPNEGRRGRKLNLKTGKWYSIEGSRLKAQGMKQGVPDIHLAVPRGPYAGLWIEMKAGRNKPTPEQLGWHERLKAHGHRVEVCWGWQAASKVIEEYLGGRKTP